MVQHSCEYSGVHFVYTIRHHPPHPRQSWIVYTLSSALNVIAPLGPLYLTLPYFFDVSATMKFSGPSPVLDSTHALTYRCQTITPVARKPVCTTGLSFLSTIWPDSLRQNGHMSSSPAFDMGEELAICLAISATTVFLYCCCSSSFFLFSSSTR